LAVGDASFQHKCFQVFRDIKKQGKTVIFVTHDMGAVQEFCDRALMIKDGNIVDIGKPRDIALSYELENINAAAQRHQVGSRPKNPVLSLDSLTVVDEKNRAQKTFKWDEDVEVEIKFTVKEAIKVSFNLFFVRGDGTYMAGYNSKSDLGEYTPKAGSHTIRCRFKGDQLIKGTYNLNLAVYQYDDPVLIDALDSSLGSTTPFITVVESSPYQDGQFYINGKWQALDKGKA
jgi:ABC-type microcin C transport system duplicated ATPase subunit YejF